MSSCEIEFSVDTRKRTGPPVEVLDSSNNVPLVEYRSGYLTRVLAPMERERIATANSCGENNVPFEVVVAKKQHEGVKLVEETQKIYRYQRDEIPQITARSIIGGRPVPVLSLLANIGDRYRERSFVVICRPKEEKIGKLDHLYLQARKQLLSTLDKKLGS